MKHIIVIVLLGLGLSSYGQRKYAADRYFKEYAYSKSAELYQDLHNNGEESYLVLSRLADSYYYTASYKKAEESYSELMKKYETEASPEHIFRYAQVLKSNGKIKESDEWMLKLKTLKESDRRVLALEANKDYFSEYTNRPKTYVNVHNLSINTSYSDFGGFIYDGYFYYSSTRPDSENKKVYKWNNQPYLNIYKTKEKNLVEGEALKVEGEEKVLSLASKFHESNAIITKDGNTLYFTRDNSDGEKLLSAPETVANLKIYKATKQNDGSWGAITELPFNDDSYSTGHPTLSADENTLYFVSDRPGGFGATDIYKVSIGGSGDYGTPENLGETINTEGREMFPFFGDDRLYFSSDGHLGLGALDIFESKIEVSGYGAPVNLGTPINGPLDDFGFVIDASKKAGYFSSNREGGKGDDDVYSFRIYECKEAIEGVITESKTEAALEKVLVQLLGEDGTPVAEQITTTDGKYSFKDLDCEKTYKVVASKQDYKSNSKELATLDVNKKVLENNITLESLIIEDQIVINPIYFDYNLYNIREDAEYELEHIVTVMKNHPDMTIRIESHTDSRGGKPYNQKLSERRAKSTKDYIVSRGIASERIVSATGFGETQLLNNCDDKHEANCTEKQHQQNRRSYFYIVNGGTHVKVTN